MPKVLISDKLSPQAVEIFTRRGIEADYEPGMSPETLLQRIGDYDGLAVRSATKVTDQVLERAERLKVVGRAGIGVDNIDLGAATAAGVVVMNTPFGNAITTAEHTVAMMMAMARQIPQADRSTRAGKWEKSRFMGVEVTGKTLGLIGCGNIGSIVADRAHGLKLRVLVYDPYLSHERAEDLNIEKVELDELLARADFISLHTPLTDHTRGLIDAAALAKTKPGVRILNCARGGLVVESALKEAIESGHVAGAAFDVFEVEPARDNPLFDLEQMIVTPHLGASTTEAQEKVALQVAEQMADYLVDGAITNALNMPSVTADEAPRLRPYMTLARELGSFAGQVTESGIRTVTIEYAGHAATLNTRPLTAIVLEALLSPLLETVNMVNAPMVARERDIDVRELRHERSSDYQTLIRVTVATERRTRDVAGTLFADKPRIVQIEGMTIEASIGAHILFVTNKDQPGFIGRLGSALGAADINIATFHLGRSAPGAEAIALVETDEPVPPAVLKDVQALPDVVSVKALSF